MPQMYPMNWLFLLLFISMTLFFYMSVINSIMLSPHYSSCQYKYNKSLLWLW